ncbi:DUF3087 domain-containing protein [Shewanella livingstonensis]|uniref:DUF3087 domain-containing protein n=1 Tax=Shewanella livingstonensis TaxID=150120 RepID=A0A3G8LYQ2_9GAMM|nr:DUF3087 domain-containing protein [Shewanella livingstonensis]AZG74819.1 DUF3087 domain-containing protein [Shewanella livingstonensis]
MKLVNIDKVQYRSVNNQVQIGLVAALAILSLVFGQLMIHFFGVKSLAGVESTGNFHLNFTGFMLAIMTCIFFIRNLRQKPTFYEVYYVWQLKQLQNKIYRKLKSVQQAAKDNNRDALVILSFYYQSLALVYNLDNNTLTMSNVNNELAKLQQCIDAAGFTIDVDEFTPEMLQAF